jgi:mannitol 2-dehydrogenase
LAAQQRSQTGALLELREVFGDLAAEPCFVAAYQQALRALHEDGARSVVRTLAAGH